VRSKTVSGTGKDGFGSSLPTVFVDAKRDSAKAEISFASVRRQGFLYRRRGERSAECRVDGSAHVSRPHRGQIISIEDAIVSGRAVFRDVFAER
jgi:hypothetical protein